MAAWPGNIPRPGHEQSSQGCWRRRRLASFVGLALLALLYFAQARDIRRLRESASFLVEGGNEDGESVNSPPREPPRRWPPRSPRRPPRPPRPPRPAKRRAGGRELARQAAERRRRFEQRRRGSENGGWESAPPGSRIGGISRPSSSARSCCFAAAFGVTRIVGGGSESATPAAQKNKGLCPPGQTRVAVLNGTPTPGLAATFAAPPKQRGYNDAGRQHRLAVHDQRGHVFDPSTGRDCAGVISEIVDIRKQQPMDNEVRIASRGIPSPWSWETTRPGGSSAGGASDTTGSGI